MLEGQRASEDTRGVVGVQADPPIGERGGRAERVGSRLGVERGSEHVGILEAVQQRAGAAVEDGGDRRVEVAAGTAADQLADGRDAAGAEGDLDDVDDVRDAGRRAAVLTGEDRVAQGLLERLPAGR